MTDRLDSLLSDLDARNGFGVRIIRNEKTGAVGYLPVTLVDPHEWERASIAMHEAQQKSVDDQFELERRQNAEAQQ